MRRLLKTTGLIALSASLFFGCKDKEIEAPDSLEPIKITFDEFLSGKFVDQTVQIDSVYFVIDESDSVGHLFNGTTSNGTGTRILSNCQGKTLDVFTSADRDFAYLEVPTGLGTIYGVASEYEGTKQLLLRTYEDAADLTREICEPSFPVYTITQIQNGEVEVGSTVKIENVEFSNISDTWGGPRTIQDCDGNTLTSYVASSASFANNTVPPGNGPMIGVIELYNTTWEIIPRSEEDGAGMINPLCGDGGGGGGSACDDTPTTTYELKDFDDASITSGGWHSEVVTGTTDWAHDNFGGDDYAKITNYSGGSNSVSEAWLISPVVDLSGSTSPILTFKNIANFSGDPLQLMVSTDYTGTGDPTVATWTDLTSSAAWDTDLTGWGSWVCSEAVDLSAYKVATVYVAFKYTGSASDGSTQEIDEIRIYE